MTPAPPLLLVAAGGLAREALAVVRATGTHDVVGILDDDPARHGGEVDGASVLGGLDAVGDHPEADVLVCAGKGRVRELLVARLTRAGVSPSRYARVRHPSVDVPAGCAVGAGSILLAHVAVTADVTIGDHVVVMPNATLTHDDVLRDYATICAGVSLGGAVVVGERSYVGMNASVREGTSLGADTTIGMGAAVLADVPPEQTWVGVPARRLRFGRAAGAPAIRSPAGSEVSR
ncbi:MAG: acetyltransferase [Georgenia sp.]